MSALAIVLCDLLHELGHLAATRLPLGVKAQSISTIGLTTDGSSRVAAGAVAVAVFIGVFGPGLVL